MCHDGSGRAHPEMAAVKTVAVAAPVIGAYLALSWLTAVITVAMVVGALSAAVVAAMVAAVVTYLRSRAAERRHHAAHPPVPYRRRQATIQARAERPVALDAPQHTTNVPSWATEPAQAPYEPVERDR